MPAVIAEMKYRATGKFKKQFYTTFSNEVHALSEIYVIINVQSL